MKRNIKKITIAIALTALIMAGMIAFAGNGATSTAETKDYVLAISEIVEAKEIEGSNGIDEGISLYTLPVGSTISLTAKSEGVQNKICYYNYDNEKTDSFIMGVDGKASDKNDSLQVDTTVYYIVTKEDAENPFMSIEITVNGETQSIFFMVELEKEDEEEIKLIVNAKPTSANILINGTPQSFQAYEIDNFNYFKLRDIAYVLSGTKKQFEVEWDAEKDAITLETGEPYTSQGNELSTGEKGIQTGMATKSTIYLDGHKVDMVAYNIKGNNYFKLRDLGQAISFAVIWDGENQTIKINTNQNYYE